jgi:hypothetical protein
MPKCKVCNIKFVKTRAIQPVCGKYDCMVAYANKVAEKARNKRIQAEKKVLKEKTKTLSDYLKETQTVFNQYIRLRDKDLPCISCGTIKRNIQYHAGHYRSVGAAPHLRFNEINVHKQCSACNNHKSGNSIEYRIRLIKRIGIEEVEKLESDNQLRKYNVPELIQLKQLYKQKINNLTR